MTFIYVTMLAIEVAVVLYLTPCIIAGILAKAVSVYKHIRTVEEYRLRNYIDSEVRKGKL